MLVRILRQAYLFWYLFFSACGLSYTLTRIVPFDLPWPLIEHHYAMMAPWQGYITHNVELVAEGLTTTDEWERIDMNQYFPHSRGERAIRDRLSSFSDKTSQYNVIAKRIWELERDAGQHWQAVQILWHKWPKSEHGFYVNHTEELLETTSVGRYDP